ncbi:glycosyltransferase family 4 protein [Salinimicrobium xinjiangense]|uniref:glycosyltransferase family 4 protein n=1 Tax=Salinimicrobium xinjiangense TaxID=438596 RepID=UPI00042251B3|nr:glycosyltransferase family 4 protein [Salinimicrobium xinjiangense]
MKILILINSFGRGGAENSTAKFILGVNQKYKDINFKCVYLEKYMPGCYEELAENGIEVTKLPGQNFLSRVKNFSKLISIYKPNIVHTILFESNMIGRFASVGKKTLLVESLVNKTYSEDRDFKSRSLRLKSYGIKYLDKITSRMVDHFHTVGHAVAKHYINVYGREIAYTVVERGRPYPPSNDQRDLKNNEKLYLVTLARQEYQKGLIYLLKAIVPHKKQLKLQIIGREGAATEAIKNFIHEHDLKNTVEFCGYLSDVFTILRKADVYVSASLYEGLPGSVIEAMSVKLPLLLSDIEEHKEVAQGNKNALFFETKKSEDLSEKIQVFQNDPSLRKKFGSYSFEIFQKKFTEEAMVDGMANFYKKICTGYRKENEN